MRPGYALRNKKYESKHISLQIYLNYKSFLLMFFFYTQYGNYNKRLFYLIFYGSYNIVHFFKFRIVFNKYTFTAARQYAVMLNIFKKFNV